MLKKLGVWQPQNPCTALHGALGSATFSHGRWYFHENFPSKSRDREFGKIIEEKTRCTTLNLEKITQRYVTWTMCFAESSCVFQASELTKRHSNNQFVLFVLATKDNHEFHTNFNKFISMHLKRSGAAMFAENCRMVCYCSDIKLLNKKDLLYSGCPEAQSLVLLKSTCENKN